MGLDKALSNLVRLGTQDKNGCDVNANSCELSALNMARGKEARAV